MIKNKILSAVGGADEGSSDPYFANTTLLLHGDGTNGAQNNMFIDSSPINFTITRNGNVTQGTFSPFSKEPGEWGVAFDESGDYLEAPDNTAFKLGNLNFTVEAWIYLNALPAPGSTQTIISRWHINNYSYIFSVNNNAGTIRLYFGYSTIGTVSFDFFQNASISANVWNHVSITRSSNTLYMFLNGVLLGSAAISATIFDGPSSIQIAKRGDGTEYFNGQISNLRIVKGTALYTSNFTPSTAPLTAVAGTSLLCCQDNRFKDNSANNFTLTPNGDVKVTPFSPFANSAVYDPAVNGGSAYFDGNGDYLTPSADPLNFGVGAFTIEAWIYTTGAPAANYGNAIIGGATDNPSRIFFGVSRSGVASGKLTIEQFGVGNIVTSSTTIMPNVWYHVVVSRDSSGTYRLFVNGVQEASNSSAYSTGTGGAYIGNASSGGGNANNPFQGYIANLRTVTGTAVYTSNFTLPTAPVTSITNTRLLLNFTNAGIYDNTGMNNLETVGNAQISTSVKKYGTGAIYFDGSGDWLTIPSNPALAFGSGDFTVELWFYTPGKSNACLIDFRTIASSNNNPTLLIQNNSLQFWTTSQRLSGTYSYNTWTHVAVCRSSGQISMYINGSSVGGYADSSNFDGSFPWIGQYVQQTGFEFPGYIDDLRITKGLARYTANFTPPARAFPDK